MMSMWSWISLERENYWRWSPRTSSRQCHNNPVLVPPRKPPDPAKDLDNGQTYDLKTRVDLWFRVDIISVEYETFAQTFHLTVWLFLFVTRISFQWDDVMWHIIVLMVCIGVGTKLIIYRIPPDPYRWSFRGFGFLWWSLMMNWMLWTKKKKVNDPSNMKLVTSLMNF